MILLPLSKCHFTTDLPQVNTCIFWIFRGEICLVVGKGSKFQCYEVENVLFQSPQSMKTEHMNVIMNTFYEGTKPYGYVIKQHQKEGRSTRDTNESQNLIHMI